MYSSKRCIVDNWSLEQAGSLLNGDFEQYTFTDELFIESLGGLSNYINAILLYDEAKFIANGFQTNWYRFSWFLKNTRLYFEPFLPTGNLVDWNSHISLPDLGAQNYLLTSKYLDADLFISPERAGKIIEKGSPEMDDNFIATLKKIDEEIMSGKETSWYNNVKIGIEHNFSFPSLTHYVLAEATNTNDLLTVIMQLKASGEIKKIKEEINELTKTTKGAYKLKNQTQNIINSYFHNSSLGDNSWSVNLNILFLTITKTFSLGIPARKSYFTFLKDVIACRAEAFSLKNQVERVFKRKVT
ncbi:MAG: hypothetical protein ACTHLB_11090 [Parafilimonas sp.]